MNILCRIFGHKSNENVYSGAEYMRIFSAQVDGMGIQHVTLESRCSRCGKWHRSGQLHLPAHKKQGLS